MKNTAQHELLLRVISALGLSVFCLAVIFFAPVLWYHLLLFGLALIAAHEYRGALLYQQIRLNFFALGVLCLPALAASLLGPAYMFVGTVAAFAGIIFAEGISRGWAQVLGAAQLKFYGIFFLCLSLPLFAAGALSALPHEGRFFILFVGLTVSASDSFAYLGGKLLGRHKLCPGISPGKTWEGSVSGVLGSMACALVLLLCSDTFASLFSVEQILILTPLVAIASQISDLGESKFKRYCGVKDSGRLLPGHGGILDRIDGYPLALPVFVVGILLFTDHHFVFRPWFPLFP